MTLGKGTSASSAFLPRHGGGRITLRARLWYWEWQLRSLHWNLGDRHWQREQHGPEKSREEGTYRRICQEKTL